MEGKILVIEDNRDDAELTRLALESLGKDARIVHLGDGALALEYLGSEAAAGVRFVILDIKLPKVDGLQVLERIKADPRTRRIPVIIFSSSSREAEIAQAFQSGANSYVVKPVELDAYMSKMTTLGRYWDEVNQPCMLR